jgi:hypothetical protein
MVVHGCNPSTREAEVGGSQMEASLRYTARPFLKKKKRDSKEYKPSLLSSRIC